MEQVDFAACKLFTDAPVQLDGLAISVVPVGRIGTSSAYSRFLLEELVDQIETTHCLVTQWDGHVLDATRWRSEFLEYDYIGASWPQFADGHDVGNGGFSLRSLRLMKLCRDPGFKHCHPEDIAIGRVNRPWLENSGMRFASRTVADLFSTERAGDLSTSFGYHGAWRMPAVLGIDVFWEIYRNLDDRGTTRHDFRAILDQVRRGQGGWQRAMRLLKDQYFYRIRR